MFNANLLAQDLADSDLDAVGSTVFETYSNMEPTMFTFVPASEEWLTLESPRFATIEDQDPGCQCCCCTGECREDYEYETAEEFEAAGFYLEQEMDAVVNAWHQAKFWSDGGSDLS